MSVGVCLDAVVPTGDGVVRSLREAWLHPDYLLRLVNAFAQRELAWGGMPSFAWVTSFDPLGGESMGEFSEAELVRLFSKAPTPQDCARPEDAQKSLVWLKAALGTDGPHKTAMIRAMGFKSERAYKSREGAILDQIEQWLELCTFAIREGALVVVRFEG